MKTRLIICVVFTFGAILFDGCASIHPPTIVAPAADFQINEIHMLDRQNGWAQNVDPIFKTNDWVFDEKVILKTTNGGRSWKIVLHPGMDDNIGSDFLDVDTAWVAVANDTTNMIIFRTTDGGESWKSATLSHIDYLDWGFLSFPDRNRGWVLAMPDHGMNSMPGYLYGTKDGGVTWQPINGTEASQFDANDSEGTSPGFADRHPYLICGGDIEFRNAPDGWLRGALTTTTRSFLFYTRDGGLNWQQQQFPLPPSLHDGTIGPLELPHFFGHDGIIGTSFDPNDRESTNWFMIFYSTRDGGKTWRPMMPVQFGRVWGVWDFISAKRGWFWSPVPHNTNSTKPVKGKLYRTRDGGRTWEVVKEKKGLENYLTHGENIIQLDFVNNRYGWAIAQDWRRISKLLLTSDGGETWNDVPVIQEQ